MKLSVNWLNDFIPLNSIPLSNVLEKINTSISEIDDLEEYHEHLSNVISVKLLSLDKHPNAEKLQITTCTDGQKNYQIVTGATNISVGDIVPLALPGTKIDGKEIIASELRGISSEGMYCSEKELGLAQVSSGVLIFPSNTNLGKSVRSIFNWEDQILTIDNKSITHRPDLWSHFGFARELASQLSLPILFNPLQSTAKFESGNDSLEVVNNSNGHAYFVCSIQQIKISNSIPKIKSRLERCGIRSINNVVDVSNYLLLEVGQPTHFFDRSKLKNNTFSIDFAKPDESFLLLDETSPKLTNDILLIRNGNDPVAIAGVMGGKDSSVTDSTTALVLESAIFKREDVRKSIRKSGIRSESAVRYEKGLDTATCLPVINRALQLLSENGQDNFKVFSPQGFNNSSEKLVKINTTMDFLISKLGKVISFDEVESILKKLGFVIRSSDKENLEVTVPRFRHNYDVTIEEDLVEEIGRTIGYASIPIKPISLAVETPLRNPLRELERKLKGIFSSTLGFHEVFNYSFSSEQESMIEGEIASSILGIANEMPKEHSVLRTSLFPGLIRQAASNQDRFDSVNLYEVGRTYHKSGGPHELASEKRWLSFIKLSNAKQNDLQSIETEFVLFRNQFSDVFYILNMKGFEWSKSNFNYLHPNASLQLSYEGKKIAEFGLLHSRFADQYDLKRRAFIGKIDLIALLSLWERDGRKSYFKTPSQFPQGQLDLSLLLDETAPSETYLDAVHKLNLPELEEGFVHSIFRGDSIGSGKKSVTYRFQLMSYERTFTQERFKDLSDTLVKLAKDSGFQLR